ncbi:MAG: AzlC family ABC transporter permease [Clostridia bacterium]|nr:AzlC family ABC transporter permease [Clostridia bacterium]
MQRNEFTLGLRDSLPVGVGYFAVSFGFGVTAVRTISAIQATVMSLTNMTSAGQFAGVGVIAAASSLWVMLLTQLVINSRYALMSLALSQKLGRSFGVVQRLIVAFYNTDEIFALAMQRPVPLTTRYMYGLGVLPIVGWASGTLLGALAGDILPSMVSNALGVALYGMFIAIVVPQAVAETPKRVAVLLSAVLSCLFTWVPWLKTVDSGLAIVICTVVAAAVCALAFPIQDKEEASR